MYRYKKLKNRVKNRDGSTVDEHRRVAGAERLGFDVVVHHKDGNKRNNHPSNLEIMSRSDHAKLHGLGRRVISPAQEIKVKPDENGNFTCIRCGATKSVQEFPKDRYRPFGFESVCKKCRSARRRARSRGELQVNVG